jgi:outer membrane protein assembly factor BamB
MKFRVILLVGILAIFSGNIISQDSPWPVFRHDQKRTARTQYTGPATPTLAWTFQTNDGVVSSPSIGEDGTIYFGSGWYWDGAFDSCLYAVNPDGSMKWCFQAGDGIFSSPTVGPDGTIYFGCIDQHIYAIEDNMTHATLKWKSLVGTFFVLASPALGPDGSVYFGNSDTKFYAYNPDGSLRWDHKVGWCIISSVAMLDDGTMYVGSKDHFFRAYVDSLEGPKWATRIGTFFDGHCIDATPAVGDDGTIYVGSDQYGAVGQIPVPVDTSFWAFNPDGSIKWVYRVGDGVESSACIAGDGTIYFGSYNGNLYALADSGSEGVLKWSFETGGAIDGSPSVDADGIVYFGSRDSSIYALYPDGSVKWTYPTNGGIESSPTIDDRGYLYIGSFDGNLYAIGTGDPDVGVVSIDMPEQVQPSVEYFPAALIKNFRGGTQSFDVSCVIDTNGTVLYADTISPNISDSTVASFASWTPGPDLGVTYNLTVNSILPADENPDNDEQVGMTISADISYVCGDANGDGQPNVGDAVFIINYVFKGGAAPVPLVAADANCDGGVNVGDAVYLISYVFSGGAAPCASCP